MDEMALSYNWLVSPIVGLILGALVGGVGLGILSGKGLQWFLGLDQYKHETAWKRSLLTALAVSITLCLGAVGYGYQYDYRAWTDLDLDEQCEYVLEETDHGWWTASVGTERDAYVLRLWVLENRPALLHEKTERSGVDSTHWELDFFERGIALGIGPSRETIIARELQRRQEMRAEATEAATKESLIPYVTDE